MEMIIFIILFLMLVCLVGYAGLVFPNAIINYIPEYLDDYNINIKQIPEGKPDCFNFENNYTYHSEMWK